MVEQNNQMTQDELEKCRKKAFKRHPILQSKKDTETLKEFSYTTKYRKHKYYLWDCSGQKNLNLIEHTLLGFLEPKGVLKALGKTCFRVFRISCMNSRSTGDKVFLLGIYSGNQEILDICINVDKVEDYRKGVGEGILKYYKDINSA